MRQLSLFLTEIKPAVAMSKKKAPAPNPKRRETAAAASNTAVAWSLPTWMLNTRLNGLLFFGLACLLYANTIAHDFVQDDAIVITDNMFTVKGLQGIPGILTKDTFFGFFKVEGKETLVTGGRYRPLTLVMFALLYQFVGNSPLAFHLLTVLLYATTCLVLYRTLLLLFKERPGEKLGPLTAWIATSIFTVHPIHTEVVANIKGCDEIVTLLGSLGALYYTLRFADTGNRIWAFVAGLVFFLACMSKENAATFTVVIPLALWFFRTPGINNSPGIWRASLPIWMGFLIFFIIRGSILDWRFGGEPMELMNNPFLKIEGNRWVKYTFSEKLATIIYTLGVYLKLLFWPWPLTHDYYPRHIGIMNFGSPAVLASLATYAGLTWYAVSGLSKKDPVRFGVLFFGLTISIVSNLVFPIGTNMGERFAFMPSVGFAISIATLLGMRFTQGNRNVILGSIVAGCALFAAITVIRNPVWESNEKLFFTDAKTSPNSAKIRNAVGSMLLEKAVAEKDEDKRQPLLEASLANLNTCLDIYPNYKDALISRGGTQFYLKQFDGAITDYRRAIQIAPDDPKGRLGLTLSLRDGGKHYGQVLGDLETAATYLTESWTLNDQDAETAHSLGVVFGIQGRAAEALPWFEKAVMLAPDNPLYNENLAKSYYFLGEKARGDKHMALAKRNPTGN